MSASIEATALSVYTCWKIHSSDGFHHFSVYIHTLKCGHDSPIRVYDSLCIKMSILLFYSYHTLSYNTKYQVKWNFRCQSFTTIVSFRSAPKKGTRNVHEISKQSAMHGRKPKSHKSVKIKFVTVFQRMCNFDRTSEFIKLHRVCYQ